MCEIYSKLTMEATDVFQVCLLLTLNIFDTFLVGFFYDFEHVDVG